jgi:HD-like signal output (HDOD) protein
MSMNPEHDSFLHAVAKTERLTPAPRILGQVMALLRDPETDINSIATLVKNDPALVTDMIRGANTVFYGRGERVSSLERALLKIGFREGVRLLNLAVARTLSSRNLDSYGMVADDFWAESLFNGLFLKALATTTNAVELDEARTAGLLRFTGRLVIDQCIKDHKTASRWNGVAALEAWETEQTGFTQAQAGALLLRNWKFSEHLTHAIEWQNQPARAPKPNWLAEALSFTSFVLPQGLGVSFAVMAADYRVPALPETDFVLQNNLNAERIGELLDSCRREFIAIGSNLYDYRKSPE